MKRSRPSTSVVEKKATTSELPEPPEPPQWSFSSNNDSSSSTPEDNSHAMYQSENINREWEALFQQNCNELSLESLLKRGADINYHNSDLEISSPLHLALLNLEKYPDWVPLLIDNGADVVLLDSILKFDEKTATDLAYEKKNIKTVLKLLCEDGAFPKNFKEIKINDEWQFKVLVDARKKLHENIRKDDIKEIELFFRDNPGIKCAYDENNRSVLSTALESKSFHTYWIMRYKGCSSGIDEHHAGLLKYMGKTDRKLMEDVHNESFERVDRHILDLLGKSRIRPKQNQEKMTDVLKYFTKLNGIEKVRPILQIASEDKSLMISFDFDRESVRNLDLKEMADDNVHGRTYASGNIMIGAKRDKEIDVLGTLAQEMAHYALNIVYNNHFKPYRAKNDEQKEKYKKVVQICQQTSKDSSQCMVISDVFKYEVKSHEAELIARVPQLMAIYTSEDQEFLHAASLYVKLFDFYDQRVFPDFEKEVSFLSARNTVRDLNKQLGVLQAFNKTSFWCNYPNPRIVSFVRKLERTQHIFLSSQFPDYLLENIICHLRKINKRNFDSKYVFVKLRQLIHGKDGNEIIKIASVEGLQLKFFILECGDSTEKDCEKVLNEIMGNCDVVLISKAIVEKLFKKFDHCDMSFEWEYLSKSLKEDILKKKVSFQDHNVVLGKIITIESEAAEALPIDKIMSRDSLLLCPNDATLLEKTNDCYVSRTLVQSVNSNSETFTEKEICEILKDRKTIVLADTAGSGKTMTARHLSQAFKAANPLSFVTFIDLMRHKHAFVNEDTAQTDALAEPKFFSQKLLQLESDFEQKLFEEFFKNSKVTFFIDGFDEISPMYKNFVLQVIETAQKFKNNVFVTTRTHLAHELEKKLKTKALKMTPLNEKDQIILATRILCEKQPTTNNNDEKNVAKEFLTKCKKLIEKKTFFYSPLHISLVTNSMKEETNMFSLFECCYTGMLNIWKQKSELDRDILANSGLNMLKIYLTLAIDSVFGKHVSERLHLPKVDENIPREVILRFGLMQNTTNGALQFVDKLFANFIIADYVFKFMESDVMTTSASMQQLFIEVMLQNDCKMIRKLIDERLQLKVNELPKRVMAELQLEVNLSLLFTLTKERLTNLIVYVFQNLQIDVETKLQLLRYEVGDKSALHAAMQDHMTFIAIWAQIERFADEKTQTKLLDMCAKSYKSVAQEAKNLKVVDFIQKKLEKLGKRSEEEPSFEEDLEEAVLMVEDCDAEYFESIWKCSQNKFSREIQKKLLLAFSKEKKNILTEVCKNENIATMHCVFKISLQLLGPDQLNKSLLRVDDYGRSGFCNAFECGLLQNLQEVLTKLGQPLTFREVTENLLMTHYEEGNILHRLTSVGDAKKAEASWKFVHKHLEPQEIIKLLFNDERTGKNVFVNAVIKNNDFINVIINWCISELGHDQLASIFTEKDGNLLHKIAKFCDNNLARTLFEFIENIFRKNKAVIVALLLEKDYDQKIPLQKSLENLFGRPAIKHFWKVYVSVLGNDRLETMLVEAGEEFYNNLDALDGATNILKALVRNKYGSWLVFE